MLDDVQLDGDDCRHRPELRGGEVDDSIGAIDEHDRQCDKCIDGTEDGASKDDPGRSPVGKDGVEYTPQHKRGDGTDNGLAGGMSKQGRHWKKGGWPVGYWPRRNRRPP